MYSGTGSNKPFVVEEKVVVAKNPCLHPGDVRVLRAVDVKALHHLVDCVVFPQRGSR
jgi:RNA-dependent RNA polymerase